MASVKRKMDKKYKIASSICGGFMFGVGIPVLFATKERTELLVVPILMIIVGMLLAFFCQKPLKYLLTNKILLLAHIFIALAMLALIIWHQPHTFLIIWSGVVTILAIYSWYHLPSKNIA